MSNSYPNNPLAPLGLACAESTHVPGEAEKLAAQARPIGDRVIVRQVVAKDRTAGGLYVPDSHVEYPPIGTVVAYGSGRCKDGTTADRGFEVGDRVIFRRRPDSDLEYAIDHLAIPKADHEKLLVLRFDDILAVVGEGVEIGGTGKTYL